jgi:hypothetical protein
MVFKEGGRMAEVAGPYLAGRLVLGATAQLEVQHT